MRPRINLAGATAIGLLIGALTLALVSAATSGGEVRIVARVLEDGRVETALQQRSAGGAWSERVRPESRFIPADARPGVWLAGSPIPLDPPDVMSVDAGVPPDPVRLSGRASASATIRSPEGDQIGIVRLTEGPRGVLIQARVRGLSAGAHGFHIHAIGSCEPDFAAAGGHFNPTAVGHGPLHEGGQHAGDLPNIHAHPDGSASADFYSDAVTLATDLAHSVFDADGSAIVIHALPDSYGADAGAGARVGCGVITPAE